VEYFTLKNTTELADSLKKFQTKEILQNKHDE